MLSFQKQADPSGCAFQHQNAGIMELNPTHGMDICQHFYNPPLKDSYQISVNNNILMTQTALVGHDT
jgi:hypothetical protein